MKNPQNNYCSRNLFCYVFIIRPAQRVDIYILRVVKLHQPERDFSKFTLMESTGRE